MAITLARTLPAWLEGEGSPVIRFWNNDVPSNIDGALRSLLGEGVVGQDVGRRRCDGWAT